MPKIRNTFPITQLYAPPPTVPTRLLPPRTDHALTVLDVYAACAWPVLTEIAQQYAASKAAEQKQSAPATSTSVPSPSTQISEIFLVTPFHENTHNIPQDIETLIARRHLLVGRIKSGTDHLYLTMPVQLSHIKDPSSIVFESPHDDYSPPAITVPVQDQRDFTSSNFKGTLNWTFLKRVAISVSHIDLLNQAHARVTSSISKGIVPPCIHALAGTMNLNPHPPLRMRSTGFRTYTIAPHVPLITSEFTETLFDAKRLKTTEFRVIPLDPAANLISEIYCSATASAHLDSLSTIGWPYTTPHAALDALAATAHSTKQAATDLYRRALADVTDEMAQILMTTDNHQSLDEGLAAVTRVMSAYEAAEQRLKDQAYLHFRGEFRPADYAASAKKTDKANV